MKTRIITGVVAAAVFGALLFFAPPWLLTAVISAVAACAVYEMLTAVGLREYPALVVIGMVFAAVAPWYGYIGLQLGLAVIGGLTVTTVIATLVLHDRLPVEKLGFYFFAVAFIPVSYAAIAYLRQLDSGNHGIFYVLFSLMFPWFSDIGAYFFGTFFGKHKLCPDISPKKTVEGLIGGVLTSAIGCQAAALIYQQCFLVPNGGGRISFLEILVLTVVTVPLSVAGDLFASVIKRQNGVKDYGRVLPGHGGFMDRCDSLLFAVPVFYLIIRNFPIIY